MHRAAYAELGLDWSYEAVEVRAEELADFLAGLGPEWRGLSLTMPLKRAVMGLADQHDRWSALAGAANTLVLEGGAWAAANTDVPGATAALQERGLDRVRQVAVLGGGATATSVLLALTTLGCTHARLLVREPSRAAATVAAVSAQPHPPELTVHTLDDTERLEADLVISTIPAGAQRPQLLEVLADVPAVFDVVYDPWPTPLADAARRGGRLLVSGMDLLAHQARLQVELMTGSRVPVDLLRDAGLAELERRQRHGTTGPG